MVNSSVCFHNLINIVSYIEADLSARSSFLRLSPALEHRDNFTQQLTLCKFFYYITDKAKAAVKASCVLLCKFPLKAGLGQSRITNF